MRRHKNLFNRIISFQNLLEAARLAQKGKRFKKPTSRFNFFLEEELWKLHKELSTGAYQPGQYHHFIIHEPKKRLISAAPYRDRVVHHALYNILEPVFEPTFIHDSYATRKDKGTHAAIRQFQEFARLCPYVLKCDIRQYFPTIDHQILLSLIQRKVDCDRTLNLIQTVLQSYETDMVTGLHPSIHPSIHPRGIPIGNLTSQFFANIYLNGLDHFIKERLACRHYLRYMDDFVMFHQEKAFLWNVREAIVRYLETLRLQLHEGKCRIFRTDHGVPFLGLIIFPKHRRIKRENYVRYRRRLKTFRRSYGEGQVTFSKIHQSIQAWIGHARHADTVRLRKFLLEDFVF